MENPNPLVRNPRTDTIDVRLDFTAPPPENEELVQILEQGCENLAKTAVNCVGSYLVKDGLRWAYTFQFAHARDAALCVVAIQERTGLKPDGVRRKPLLN